MLNIQNLLGERIRNKGWNYRLHLIKLSKISIRLEEVYIVREDTLNKKQKILFIIVKNAINKWNPYELLPEAPADEFDSEIKSVAAKISFESSVDDIARVISRVFSSSFEKESFHVNDCLTVAREVKQNIDIHTK